MVDPLHQEIVNEVIGKNVATAMEQGPGLRYDTGLVVVARDPEANMVLVQGFGPFGVGSMWCRDDEDHRRYPGYDSCPIARYVADLHGGKLGRPSEPKTRNPIDTLRRIQRIGYQLTVYLHRLKLRCQEKGLLDEAEMEEIKKTLHDWDGAWA